MQSLAPNADLRTGVAGAISGALNMFRVVRCAFCVAFVVSCSCSCSFVFVVKTRRRGSLGCSQPLVIKRVVLVCPCWRVISRLRNMRHIKVVCRSIMSNVATPLRCGVLSRSITDGSCDPCAASDLKHRYFRRRHGNCSAATRLLLCAEAEQAFPIASSDDSLLESAASFLCLMAFVEAWAPSLSH